MNERYIEKFITGLQWDLRSSHNSSSCLGDKQREFLKESLIDFSTKQSQALSRAIELLEELYNDCRNVPMDDQRNAIMMKIMNEIEKLKEML